MRFFQFLYFIEQTDKAIFLQIEVRINIMRRVCDKSLSGLVTRSVEISLILHKTSKEASQTYTNIQRLKLTLTAEVSRRSAQREFLVALGWLVTASAPASRLIFSVYRAREPYVLQERAGTLHAGNRQKETRILSPHRTLMRYACVHILCV